MCIVLKDGNDMETYRKFHHKAEELLIKYAKFSSIPTFG